MAWIRGAFVTGKQPQCNRESLLTFIGEDVASVRWRQFRIYPKQFVSSAGNPAMYGLNSYRQEGTGFPAIFNIEADPREELNVFGTSAWVIGPYLKLIREYQQSLQKYPNPKAVNMTEFGRCSSTRRLLRCSAHALALTAVGGCSRLA